jgi:uridine monophosphate synthetase
LKNLGLDLYDKKIVKLGAFKSVAHERDPNLPLLPIYTNLRDAPSEPSLMVEMVRIYERVIFKKKLDLRNDLMVGIPLAGVPIASILSVRTGIPMIILRKEEKTHGVPRKIEGKFNPGQVVIVIDDVIGWGDSKFKYIKPLEAKSLKVIDILVLVDLGLGGSKALREAGYRLHAIFEVRDLLSIFLEHNRINQKEYDRTIDLLKEK